MDYAEARAKLIVKLSAEVTDQRVLEAMAKVPRERFIPPEIRASAYEDIPLSIGHGQTISQPFIVALMTQALELKENDKVLEVGTGSGYQAAILSLLAGKVISVERVNELARQARWTLHELGYRNVWVYQEKEELGWTPKAPYDVIIVTAAAPKVPASLLKQLKEKGRLVIPVGSYYEQQLYKITRLKGKDVTEVLCGCRFVPLIGEEAWRE
jgi:protein-L-isoaspartate(D-aspartate) O-methyltransferase